MDHPQRDPLFVAQEAICFYPISTIYNSCPRYLFYALLLASCVSRWTGWLADVFLGTAATYAGVAAIQAFILVADPSEPQDPGPVTIPRVSNTSSLWSAFPQLVTDTDQVMIQPGALELDSDAVLAIVVTGYLVFLPLQCWSRILSHQRARNVLFYIWNILMLAGSICALVYSPKLERTPVQYMFCYPDLPPLGETSSDGWHDSWRTSTWNTSVWDIFSNITLWSQLGDTCFNPCMNSSQILRDQDSLDIWVGTNSFEVSNPHRFWNKVIYSKRYIYSLIILCVILNCLLLTFKFLPFRSRIPSSRIVIIWRERKSIWNSFKEELREASPEQQAPDSPKREESGQPQQKRSAWQHIRRLLTVRFWNAFLHVVVDMMILFGILFSMIVSPFTVIAFVAWIEWCIYNDGPSQEHPQQVGQWAYLVSIGLLVISAGILTLKYRLATTKELDIEIDKVKEHLGNLQRRRDALLQPETDVPMLSQHDNVV
ncbi:hypothetical protein N7510_002804 [Penicillium lagena]|uniref:uncharacterized protein n=1 Tax=Penicillium lagena TaxID=94218 RepID=UPI002541E604|nr:uncharacterized protein N7510_002804 [Penicillium lagena]KAJ5618820.1 hypothetical protein N7510_002804 [Penicillium lagena]